MSTILDDAQQEGPTAWASPSNAVLLGRVAMGDWYRKTTFACLLDDAAQRWGGREALYHETNRFSFEQLKDNVNAAARGFIGLGIMPGDKVALWMPNRPEWIIAFLGLSKIGAVTVPMNTRFRALDLEYVIHQSDSSTLISIDRSGPMDYLSLIRQVVPEIETGSPANLRPKRFPELKRVVILGTELPTGAYAWQDMMHRGAAVPVDEMERRNREVDPDDTTLMLYTSGTTGFPKGVMHSHNIQRNVVDIANRLGYRTDSRDFFRSIVKRLSSLEQRKIGAADERTG